MVKYIFVCQNMNDIYQNKCRSGIHNIENGEIEK